MYMISQIFWHIVKVGIGPFVDKISDMNTYNQYLPRFKEEEGSPNELVQDNDPFMQLELCNVILSALSFGFASTIWASKGAKSIFFSI